MSGQVQPTCLWGNLASFAADMRKMINAPEFSDVKFIVGKERKVVYAHRCILAHRCEAFSTMFAQQPLSRDAKGADIPFVVSDVQPDVFLAVIEFLYTNSVMLSSKMALEVLTSAVEYGLDDLQKLCVDYISSTLTVESACEALQSIVKTQGFHELSDPAMLVILQSDMLTIDEPDLINFVREWAHVNSVVLDKSVPEIAKEVVRELRLFLLTPDELTALEVENKKDNLIPGSFEDTDLELHADYGSLWEWDPLSAFHYWPLFSTPRAWPKSSTRLQRTEFPWPWRRWRGLGIGGQCPSRRLVCHGRWTIQVSVPKDPTSLGTELGKSDAMDF
ncbi:BTB/POZ domain-containing protein 19-like isoform X4 [Mobula hypostoma]|uniref:BTB/POZ domain-containing protein 19-like isoform X4 n=1 Tax=Mobula hypostoma TaxID=723540 RepID=UPI002FC2AB07